MQNPKTIWQSVTSWHCAHDEELHRRAVVEGTEGQETDPASSEKGEQTMP